MACLCPPFAPSFRSDSLPPRPRSFPSCRPRPTQPSCGQPNCPAANPTVRQTNRPARLPGPLASASRFCRPVGLRRTSAPDEDSYISVLFSLSRVAVALHLIFIIESSLSPSFHYLHRFTQGISPLLRRHWMLHSAKVWCK